MLGLGWWLGSRGSGPAALAEYQQITFRTGSIGNARFTPDGSIVYSAVVGWRRRPALYVADG